MENDHKHGLMVLRIALGLLFLIPGIMRLMAPSMIIGMLGGMGIPAAALMGWVLILVEVLGGLMLILGMKTRYAIWPLGIVMIVAIFAVVIPGIGQPMGVINLLFHVLAIAGLAAIYLDGCGSCGMCKDSACAMKK